jgi:hypothetical protein
VTDYRCCRPKCTRRCGGNFAMGFQTPPDHRAVMTVTTDGYKTRSLRGERGPVIHRSELSLKSEAKKREQITRKLLPYNVWCSLTVRGGLRSRRDKIIVPFWLDNLHQLQWPLYIFVNKTLWRFVPAPQNPRKLVTNHNTCSCIVLNLRISITPA